MFSRHISVYGAAWRDTCVVYYVQGELNFLYSVESRKWVSLEVRLNKYKVLSRECGDGSGWDCVKELTHALLSGFFYITGFLHIQQSAV
jgi:hypothetical protein